MTTNIVGSGSFYTISTNNREVKVHVATGVEPPVIGACSDLVSDSRGYSNAGTRQLTSTRLDSTEINNTL